MVMAAELSGLGSADVTRLRTLIEQAGLPATPPKIEADVWMQTMGMDKKVEQNRLRFVLLRGIG